MTVATRDFNTPARPGPVVLEHLHNWMERSVQRLDRIWQSQLCWPLSVEMGTCDPVYSSHIPDLFSSEVLTHRVELGAHEQTTLMVCPVPLAIALLNGLIGEPADALPDPRELTSVEMALYQQLLEHVADSFRKGWSGDGAPAIRPQGRANLNDDELGLLQSEEPFLCFNFQVKGPFGEAVWAWLAPKTVLVELVQDVIFQGEVPEDPNELEKLAQVIHAIESKLTVCLGRMQLDLPALRTLSVGDVLVLDQPIDQPLTALVGDTQLFHVWGGRIGDQHAIQIQEKLGD